MLVLLAALVLLGAELAAGVEVHAVEARPIEPGGAVDAHVGTRSRVGIHLLAGYI